MGGVYLSGSTKQASQLCQIFVVRKIKLKYGQCALSGTASLNQVVA
jgi:hypothetical protein